MEQTTPSLLGTVTRTQESFQLGGVEIMRLVYDFPAPSPVPLAAVQVAQTRRKKTRAVKAVKEDMRGTARRHTVKLIEALTEVARGEILPKCETGLHKARAAGAAYRFTRYTCTVGCRETQEGHRRRIEVSFSVTAGRERLHFAACTMYWNAEGTVQLKKSADKKQKTGRKSKQNVKNETRVPT